MKYPYIDDPEPQTPPETGEDRFIRRAGRIFNIIIAVAAAAMAVLAICGIVIRHM